LFVLPPLVLALVLPPAFELRFVFVFMFEPFMLLAFELVPALVLLAFDVVLVFVFDVVLVFVFADVFVLLLAFVVLALLVLSPPPQAERLATPANARSAKVLRMDRSPELL
jgi:hypothetical protein